MVLPCNAGGISLAQAEMRDPPNMFAVWRAVNSGVRVVGHFRTLQASFTLQPGPKCALLGMRNVYRTVVLQGLCFAYCFTTRCVRYGWGLSVK